MESDKPIENNTGKAKKAPVRISYEEYEIIKKLTTEGWTDEKIAKQLNRDINTIRSARKRMGLQKKSSGLLSDESLDSTVKEGSLKFATDDQKMASWARSLYKSSRYDRLKKTLPKSELDFFVEQWCQLHVQFEDLLPTEENDIEQLIIYQIRLQDNVQQRNEAKKQIDRLKDMIGELGTKELDLQDDNQRFIYESIQSSNRFLADLNKDYRELTTKYNDISKSLNATREQRESKARVGGDTFLTLVKKFNDSAKRAEMGRHDELMRMATEKQLEKMKENHTFIDNEIAPLLLDGSDYVGKKYEQNTDSGSEQSIGSIPNPEPDKK